MLGWPTGATRLTLPSCALTGLVLPSDELGLQVAGQRIERGRAVLACPGRRDERDRPVVSPLRMRGCAARPRDPAADARAAGWRPAMLLITIRRYRCTGCGHVWRQDTSRAAEPREAVASRAAMGARRHRVSALDRRSGRRGPRRVAHRERRGAGRRQQCADRGSTPVRPADSGPNFTLDYEEPVSPYHSRHVRTLLTLGPHLRVQLWPVSTDRYRSV